MAVKVNKTYHVYYYSGHNDKLKLIEERSTRFTEFDNHFDSEEEAIQALIDNEMFHIHYIILPKIYITNFDGDE